MELVYLWVEDYKNIQKQGFNFSPRFTCDYNDEINELTIDENDDYIENFFGENINVTAIVGKNGSGKSSVLECLKQYANNMVLVFKNNETLQYYSKNKLDSTIKKVNNNPFNMYRFYTNSSILHMDKMDEFMEDKISLELNEIIKKVIYSENYKSFELASFMYIPKKIIVWSNYIDKFFNNMLAYSLNSKKLREIEFDTYHKFLTILYVYFVQNIDMDDISPEVFKEFKEEFNDKKIFLNGLCNTTLENIQKKDFLEKELFKYTQFSFTKEKFENIHFHQRSSGFKDISELSKDEKFFLKEYFNLYHIDLFDIKERRYTELSHGEKILFGQLLNIDYILKNNRDVLFLFDEPDLALHPNWQKQYFNEVYNLFSKFDKKIHFIFTTHSSFMLSDIPKQNIIFLDKDEKGNCKVVNGLKEKKQTFGANIHTLLSDSFFMEDGLMGEFAKSKIDKAITLLNQDKLSDDDLKYCEQIISIIGEPIVKNQLQRMLDSKRLKKIDEIDAIKQSMIEMQQRLDELEK